MGRAAADLPRVFGKFYARTFADLRAYLGSSCGAVGIEFIHRGERIHSPLEMNSFAVVNDFVHRWE